MCTLDSSDSRVHSFISNITSFILSLDFAYVRKQFRFFHETLENKETRGWRLTQIPTSIALGNSSHRVDVNVFRFICNYKYVGNYNLELHIN
jgi:hypothetical protein